MKQEPRDVSRGRFRVISISFLTLKIFKETVKLHKKQKNLKKLQRMYFEEMIILHIFKFLKVVFLSIFCTCEDTKSTVYYTEIWPSIKVYREDVCKKCGSCSTILLAEYIHDLEGVRRRLEAKGIPSAIDISKSYIEEK